MMKMLVLTGLVMGSVTAYASADEARYELKRVGTPRGDRYVMVHVEREGDRAPYALTGAQEQDRGSTVRFIGPRYTPRIVGE